MKSEDKIGRWIKGEQRDELLARGDETMGELFGDQGAKKVIGIDRWNELLKEYESSQGAGAEEPVAIAEIQLADARELSTKLADDLSIWHYNSRDIGREMVADPSKNEHARVIYLARDLLVSAASSPRGNISTSWVHTCFEVAKAFVREAERYGNA